MADADLEEELMDLSSNELAYLPSGAAPTAPRRSLSSAAGAAAADRLTQQVAEQLLAQATQHVAAQREQQHSAQTPAARDEELLTAEQLQFLADEDARLERRNAVVRELTAARKAAMARRLDDLVLQLEQLQQRVAQRVQGGGEAETERRRQMAREQMTAKLDFVVEKSASEVQVVDEDVQWTRLLAELPVEERDYLGRAADEKFVEQMKYLRGERENEREGAIRQHLHEVLVLTPPHRNGQTVAKTSMHHSLRHLLQAFANIFRGCYAGFLQYGGQGFGVRPGVSVDRVTCALPLVAADVTQFASILGQVVLFKYPCLQSSESQRSAVERSVLAALFDALQPALHGLYVASFQREDAIVDDIAELSRTNPLEYFEVRPLFRLDGSWPGIPRDGQPVADRNERRLMTLHQYSAAIYHMNNLASERSPFAKLERLALVCREVDHAVKTFYELQVAERRPSPEEQNITTEDLCTLLSFIVVSAPSSCLHLFTQLALLGSFTPQSVANGREGFALASCVAAVRHLLQLR